MDRELFLREHLPEGVETERILSDNPRSCVELIREPAAGKRWIFRTCMGGGEVYRLLEGRELAHLPRVEAVAEEAGHVFVLEEYIQGDSLAFLMENGPLPETQVRRISGQLCLALDCLHGLGAVHRDVKPDNIILRGDEAVLVDLDASRIAKPRKTGDTQVMGTAGYAAPEQFGLFQTDGRADVYAMGVLINEMLTGEHPSVRLAEGALGPVVEKCVEVNMDRRYNSAAELRSALLSQGGIHRSRRRLFGGLAVFLGVILFAGLGLLFFGKGSMPLPEPVEDLNGYTTEFSYDLDGDGAEEKYLFGVGADLPGLKPGTHDRETLFHGNVTYRLLAPCVWRRTEGGYVWAEKFAERLTEPDIIVVGVERSGDNPDIHAAEDMEGIWPGTVEVVYDESCTGTWRITASARLDGETLTAELITVIALAESDED